jgi:hypothetical protein
MHDDDTDKRDKYEHGAPGKPAFQQDFSARVITERKRDREQVPESEENQNSQNCVVHCNSLAISSNDHGLSRDVSAGVTTVNPGPVESRT